MQELFKPLVDGCLHFSGKGLEIFLLGSHSLLPDVPIIVREGRVGSSYCGALISRIISPKDVHILTLELKNVTLHGKRELRLQMLFS